MEGLISLELDSTQIVANEGSGTVEITITRSQGSNGTVTVDYRSFDNSAIAGSDYTTISDTATFNDGETSQTISIPILEDDLVEGSETFSFTIDNATGGANLLSPRTAFITIEDNDFNPDALVFNGNQYLFTSIATSWQEAQSEAESLGGNLVTINDRTEEIWLRENFSEIETLWIGLNDVDTEGQFQWASGQPVTYTNFAPGEPNDFNGIQDFGVLNFGSAGEWDDEFPTSVFRGIIEIGDSNPTPPDLDDSGPEPVRRTVITGLDSPTSIDWTPDGETIFIGEKGGVIKAFVDGQLRETPVIDISDQVNEFLDRGLEDIAIHPDFFDGSPYLYAAYTYDPPEVFDNTGLAGPDGSGNRAGRVGRFTVDLETLTVVPDSEEVILGRNSTWDNFNGFVDSTIDFEEPPALGIVNQIPDFLAGDSVSHSLGSVEFGPDGALYVSNGDGTSFNQLDPRTVRVQELDNLSGKILRIDPITGEGLADNPFYDGDPHSNRSKIYQYGLRNPFRFNVDPETGTIYIGDVGWFTWEEVNVGGAGENFGWPFYEGGSGTNIRTPEYQFLPEARAFYGTEQDNSTPPILALNHITDNINAIVGGDIYRGDAFPEEFQGDLFINDLGQGIVRNVSFDDAGNITDVDVFVDDANTVVQIVQGADDNLYFVELFNGVVGRWEFETTDLPVTIINPLADITVLENADAQIIDLNNVFLDEDGDEIAFVVQNNSNTELVTAVINGSHLNLDFLDNQSGTASITIRATANGTFIDDTFIITVNENVPDIPPRIINPLDDITVLENADDQIIALNNVFFDEDGDEITFSVQNNNNEELVVAVIDGSDLNLDFLDNQFGTANITIRATANEAFIDDAFIVTVNEDIPDIPPRIINPLDDITVLENADDQIINLTSVFLDEDGDEITFSVQNNNNEELVTAVIDGSDLNLDFLDNQSGTANITIRATANGISVDDTFVVTVNDNLLDSPIYRFQSTRLLGTYLFVGEDERQSINQNFADSFVEEGVAFNAALESDDELITIFRFQNTQRPGTYLYVGEEERNSINSNPDFAHIFTEEGIAFYVYGAGAGVETPFSRFQNSFVPGTYLYATGDEADHIRSNFPNFIEEGIAFEAQI